jgi:eukaryotic-like serine/threonine-protein kinase
MIGEQFGHYEIESRVGSGGMGVVYLARDLRLERYVAIKFLPDGRTADAGARERFLREARALSRLNHPNIATIYDFDQKDGRDFLVMEYIEGRSVRDFGPEPLPPADVIKLGVQLAEALDKAHGAGVVHLDVKPGNLMLTSDGRLKVLDFGLARLQGISPMEVSTHTGTIAERLTGPAGTPPYMSPEQVLATQVDRRTDIYSAGATLYELLTGRRVFDAPRADINALILKAQPEPPSRYNGAICPELDATILKALAKHPGDRQQSAAELLGDLRRCAVESGIDTVPMIVRVLRHWRLVAVALAIVVATSVIGWKLWPVPPFHERDFVLIGDLDTESVDQSLGPALKEALTIALQQSHFVNVTSRERVVETLDRMQRPATTTIDEETGLDICRREGINALILGDVGRAGDETRLTVRVLAAATGSLLTVEHAEYQKATDVFDRIDNLARQVRRDLGESLDRISASSQPLEKVTTGSFKALVQYSKAVDARAMGKTNEIEAPLLVALALDPNFAMAQLKLGDYYQSIAGDDTKGLSYLDAAFRLRDHVSQREGDFIAATYFAAHDQYELAQDHLKILTTLFPDEPEYHYELAQNYFSLENLRPAIAELRQAIRLNPLGVRAHGSLVLFLVRDNDPDAALDASREAQNRGLHSPYLYWGHGLALLAKGDFAGARSDFEALGQAHGYTSLGRLQEARALLSEGRLAEGITRLRDFVELTHREHDGTLELVGRILLGRAEALAGDLRAAREQATAVSTLTSPVSSRSTHLRDAGVMALEAGDRNLAQEAFARLKDLETAAPTPLVKAARSYLAGALDLYDHQPTEALQLVAESQSFRPWYGNSVIAASAHETLGDWASAEAAWREVLNAKGQVLQDGSGFPPDLKRAQDGRVRSAKHVSRKER